MGRNLGFSMRGKKYSLTLLGLAGLIAAGILTGLLCGEFLCRAFVRFPPEKKYLIFSSLGCAEIPPASRDADLFWRSSPEFRGGVYVKTKPAGGVRVICLGDSVTQGYPLGTNADLPAEQTYPRFLEETLKTVFPQAMVEVINAGIGGYSSLQGYRYLRDTLTGYAPDLVIKTGGQHLTDFLIWQSVYSEIFFSDVNWKFFRKVDFLRILRDFQARERRFGA